jgi:hypothetical protein
MEKTTPRAHMHKGASQQLTEKHRGARRGRTRPKWAWASRPRPAGLACSPFDLGARLFIVFSSVGRHIHLFIREPPTRGEAPGGNWRPLQVLKLLRRWLRLDPSHHGWPCVVKPWWSSGAMPWIHRGTCTFDGDINLILSLLLIYFDACFLSFMCVASIWPL